MLMKLAYYLHNLYKGSRKREIEEIKIFFLGSTLTGFRSYQVGSQREILKSTLKFLRRDDGVATHH